MVSSRFSTGYVFFCEVIRHPVKGSVARAASVCSKPVLNAGDG
jgi:aspartate carbamoyltransferase catalytic subunit